MVCKAMSPTLLELIVAILLLWVAWQIGMLIGPRVIASFVSFWRDSRPSFHSGRWPEKNVTPTPPAASDEPPPPPPPHGHPRK